MNQYSALRMPERFWRLERLQMIGERGVPLLRTPTDRGILLAALRLAEAEDYGAAGPAAKALAAYRAAKEKP
jgi:hypothetical protein